MGNAFRAGLDNAAPHARDVTVRDPKTAESGESHTYAMLGIIQRNFKYLNSNSFVLLYKSMVSSHPVLSRHQRSDDDGGRQMENIRG